MSLQLTPVPYQGGGSGAATPTLTGLRRRSVWDRFTREGALESASVSRSEAAELNNRAKWLEQRLAECEDQLKQAVEEIVEMNRRERMLDEAVSEAEQASRNERVKLQMLAQEAQIKCDIIEKEKDALLQQLQSERLKRAELAQEIEATTREKGTAAREAAQRETSMRAEVEALRKAKDDLEAAKKREVEELTKRCDNLESQLSQNLASFKFDVRNLRAKEKQIEEREEELELLQADLLSKEEELAAKVEELSAKKEELSEKEMEVAKAGKRLIELQDAAKAAATATANAVESSGPEKKATATPKKKKRKAAPPSPASKPRPAPPGQTGNPGDEAKVDYTEEEIMKMRVSDLRSALSQAGVATQKKMLKAALVKLALEHLASAGPGGAANEDGAGGAEGEPAPKRKRKAAQSKEKVEARAPESADEPTPKKKRKAAAQASPARKTARRSPAAPAKGPSKSQPRRSTRKRGNYVLDRLS